MYTRLLALLHPLWQPQFGLRSIAELLLPLLPRLHSPVADLQKARQPSPLQMDASKWEQRPALDWAQLQAHPLSPVVDLQTVRQPLLRQKDASGSAR